MELFQRQNYRPQKQNAQADNIDCIYYRQPNNNKSTSNIHTYIQYINKSHNVVVRFFSYLFKPDLLKRCTTFSGWKYPRYINGYYRWYRWISIAISEILAELNRPEIWIYIGMRVYYRHLPIYWSIFINIYDTFTDIYDNIHRYMKDIFIFWIYKIQHTMHNNAY